MNPISKFFKFIYNDLKSDIETVHYVFKQTSENKPILNPEKKKIFIQELKTAPKRLLKESWIWILVIILAFAFGHMVGMKDCEVQCYNFIQKEYYPRFLNCHINYTQLPVISPGLAIFPSDDSEPQGNNQYDGKYDVSYNSGQVIP